MDNLKYIICNICKKQDSFSYEKESFCLSRNQNPTLLIQRAYTAFTIFLCVNPHKNIVASQRWSKPYLNEEISFLFNCLSLLLIFIHYLISNCYKIINRTFIIGLSNIIPYTCMYFIWFLRNLIYIY